MNESSRSEITASLTRRGFIKKTAVAAAGVTAAPMLVHGASTAGSGRSVAIVLQEADTVALQAPARWAATKLKEALNARGLTAELHDTLANVPANQECIFAAGSATASAKQLFQRQRMPDAPDAMGFARGKVGKRNVLMACGSNPRGVAYALLELAERVRLAANPLAALRAVELMVEKPANAVRSVGRLFTSDVEDKPWYNSHEFWEGYLTMLEAQRFNRFHLVLGLAYDFTNEIRDCYFHFAYPFLLNVPGYNVRAVPLPDSERDSNLEMLKFISEQCVLRGIRFQIGLWTHAYKWTNPANGPVPNYTMEGLANEQQGPYCRDALKTLLQACPMIECVALRIHGESGVQEGSYDFWKTVMDGLVQCGRKVDLELHAKGLDQKLLDIALATGMPVAVAPKFWAEHMGLPYPQAAIRALELPVDRSGFFSLSTGSRNHTRYGYADFLTEGRKYGIIHRIWPGTQRVLLWGDPEMAAAYSRESSFSGSDGFELFEPLSFKGRKGSGIKGSRQGYADLSLDTGVRDYEKYVYSYALWGRLGYNPSAKPEVWQRVLQQQVGASAEAAGAALASSSRILPLVTTAHCPSAANNNYWPEMYVNMPIVNLAPPTPYSDTPSPKRFGTVSTLDPELFSGIDEFAGELLKGERSGKYSPAEVAQWLQDFSQNSTGQMTTAKSKAGKPAADFRRLELDVAIQNGLGLFFAWKFRAGVLYALYVQSGHRPALEQALSAYRLARKSWAELAERTRGVYVADVTYGVSPDSRGHWTDRLAAIDADIADMERKSSESPASKADGKVVARAMAAVLAPAPRPAIHVDHKPVTTFKRAAQVKIAMSPKGKIDSVELRYRHVDQAEMWQSLRMTGGIGSWTAIIPPGYTDSPYPLQYYFVIHAGQETPVVHPGLGKSLMNQPYFVIRQA